MKPGALIERFPKPLFQRFVKLWLNCKSAGGGRLPEMRKFWRQFCRDRRGNYALMTAIAMVPLMGAVAMAVDYSELSRQRQMVLNALDAANFAAARRLAEGATDDQIRAYAVDFFNANLNNIDPANISLDITLPTNQAGGGLMTMSATLNYTRISIRHRHCLSAYRQPTPTRGSTSTSRSQVRLKNTLEVAMVLDNSGSMTPNGTGSGQKRIDLLKQAAKQLVNTLAQQAAQIKQVDKPVQFCLVPFAASVNVGPDNDNASWMDIDGPVADRQ